MPSLRDVLTRKSPRLFTIQVGATVFEAIEIMARHSIGSLLVLEGEEPRGIVTERDYLRKVALEGRSSRTTRVDAIMSSPLVCAAAGDTIEQALAVMTEKRCRHLPVMSEGRVEGLVSIGDLVKHLVAEQEVLIRHLNDYIGGKYPG